MSGNSTARLGVVVGALALAAIPIAVASSWVLAGVGLLEATEVGVPVSLVLGLVAVAATRRAGFRLDRSVTRPGEALVRVARLLAWGALYVATTGAIALGFYGLLVLRG